MVVRRQRLDQDDFLQLLMILENRVKVFLDEEKKILYKKRSQIASNQGYKSSAYIDQLVSDVEGLMSLRDYPTDEIVEAAKIKSTVLECSFEHHIADE